MRSTTVLSVIVFGCVILQTWAAPPYEQLKLNYDNRDESVWSVNANGDPDAVNALMESGGPYLFDPSKVQSYEVHFKEDTFVERVKLRFIHADVVSVAVFKDGSQTSIKEETKTTNSTIWTFYNNPFIFNKDKVRKIRITWTAAAGATQLGMKKLVIVVRDPCEQWKLNAENYGGLWTVQADGNVPDAEAALKLADTKDGVKFDSTVTYFSAMFNETAYVERVKVDFLDTEEITVEAFKEDSLVADKTETKTTGGADWEPGKDAFVFDLEDVEKIKITWKAKAGVTEVGMRRLEIVICGFKPEVSDKCLDCMCAIQSTGNMKERTPGCQIGAWWTGTAEGEGDCASSGCIVDRQHCRCGPYLITEQQFKDCKGLTSLPFDDFKTCAWNQDCVRQCLKAYMAEFALSCTGHPKAEDVTCSDFARMLYGGKNDGCKKKKTDDFGKSVSKCADEDED